MLEWLNKEVAFNNTSKMRTAIAEGPMMQIAPSFISADKRIETG